jgi:nicotinamidase-related amidase
MPDKNENLHGFVPDKSSVALLLIDVINDLEFPEAEDMLDEAVDMARSIAALKKRASELKIPTIYVNDNFGRWQSDFHGVVEHCRDDNVRGKPVAELLAPQEKDYFILKPKHSGFFSTSLDILLEYLQAKTLILTGIAGNICVLFTANDAYMRDFQLFVPADCVCSNTPEENNFALKQMERILKVDTSTAEALDLENILHDRRYNSHKQSK